jgi:hypothetical protein
MVHDTNHPSIQLFDQREMMGLKGMGLGLGLPNSAVMSFL